MKVFLKRAVVLEGRLPGEVWRASVSLLLEFWTLRRIDDLIAGGLDLVADGIGIFPAFLRAGFLAFCEQRLVFFRDLLFFFWLPFLQAQTQNAVKMQQGGLLDRSGPVRT